MRHRKSFNHLGRTSAHRKAMLSNMASSLIMQKRIKTTTAKAKALKQYLEPIITRSKDDTTHSRRVVFNYLQDKDAVTELFREVAVKVKDRPGGYTRIIKLGSRLGDSAEMCFIELVDYNENLLAEKAAEKKTTRRRRGTRKKEQTGAEVTPPPTQQKEEDTTVKEEPVSEGLSDEEPVADALHEEQPSEKEPPVKEEALESEDDEKQEKKQETKGDNNDSEKKDSE
ncbi:MAG: 50S ribosomal protein L17 [Bacteroidales bacterium]|nr:50S ribosomal protein L17 [Bacteroidales bacterium]MBN2698161.1 50S ribosomal protein L17 [Bacteroidales bacterium]